ncbi:hypothetical protein [Amycolatopsis sp. NBC_01480]|uniref:hypothetical protein n=1 Tax=Amycolatopsis sp. NBC_01480 TaxID=2903562 RepID=UPI002E2E3676|nr:hypothetical protein [Amycolatopsis sp. NBC_01480]
MTTVRSQSDYPVTTDVDHRYCLTINREYDTVHASDRRSRSSVDPALPNATVSHGNERPAQDPAESAATTLTIATLSQVDTALADLMADLSPRRPA